MSPRVSDEAVRSATGRDWAGWFARLSEAESGTEWSHRDLVSFLEAGHRDAVNAWWRQMIVNAYEKHTGRRRTGETADAGFQVGVQMTLDAPRSRVWAAIAGPEGLARWLGEGGRLRLEEGATYGDPDGAGGEVRVVVPGDRVRLTWQPGGWPRPSTLQLRLTDAGDGRTVASFHHEHLPDAASREAMRERWRTALGELRSRVRP